MICWDGERAGWKDPIKDIEYEKVGAKFVEAGQYVYKNFIEEDFYEYTITKAIDAGQSLKGKEKILKRQMDRSQRLGKKPLLAKYKIVKRTREVATKQGGYVTKFLEYYNKPFIALPLAAWINVFTTGGSIPEESDFRNSIKRLISKYLEGTIPEISRYPWLDKEIKNQINIEKK